MTDGAGLLAAFATRLAKRGGGPDGQRLGAWLELSVEADIEAVEAVSEILGRVAPGGTSVEPAFELVDEGLGARIDPTPPGDRSGLRARRATRPPRERAAAEVGRGARPSPGLRPAADRRATTRLVHEADWAEAWKAHFPVLRVGRRLVIRPTWRRHRREPDDVVLALDPGMAFGTGLHPTTRLCLAGWRRWRIAAALDGARVLDVGCGSGILAIAAVRLGPLRRGRRHGPDRDRGDHCQRGAQPPSRRIRARAGACRAARGRSTSSSRTSSPSCSSRSRPISPESSRPTVAAPVPRGIFEDREATVRDAFGAARLRSRTAGPATGGSRSLGHAPGQRRGSETSQGRGSEAG